MIPWQKIQLKNSKVMLSILLREDQQSWTRVEQMQPQEVCWHNQAEQLKLGTSISWKETQSSSTNINCPQNWSLSVMYRSHSPSNTISCTSRPQVINYSWSVVERLIKPLPLWNSVIRLSTTELTRLIASRWMNLNMPATDTLSAALMTSS